MTILLYIDGWPWGEASLLEALGGEVAGVPWEVCRDATQLVQLLSRPGRQWAAVVAAVGAPARLRGLEPLRERLAALGLLLLLPSQDELLVRLGHRLAPRFLVGGPDAPAVIVQVLEQMLSSRGSRAGQGRAVSHV